MEIKMFEAVLVLLVPQIVSLIAEKNSCNELDAIRALYESKLYSLLEKEETKLWKEKYEDLKQRALKAYRQKEEEIETLKEKLNKKENGKNL